MTLDIRTIIEKRAIERGRHLTAREQLENLAAALVKDDAKSRDCDV